MYNLNSCDPRKHVENVDTADSNCTCPFAQQFKAFAYHLNVYVTTFYKIL